MPRKSLSYAFTRAILVKFVLGAAFPGVWGMGQESRPSYLGATSCASSGCHGGGGQNQNQFHVWSLRDPHSQRPFATLTTARSKQISEALGIKDPANADQCTTCHAPLKAVPLKQHGSAFKVNEGVSCESCHGPAEHWLRAHTRKDWTREDRVASGMRDLKNLYVRANTCVACHQTVESVLLKAGHPELIFELDGQSVTEPKHWREATNQSNGQIWLVGQAVALREISWQLSREPSPSEERVAQWRALLWLIQKMDGLEPTFPKLASLPNTPSAANFATIQKTSDELAQRISKFTWTETATDHALKSLAGTADDFQKSELGPQTNARRAERLVLGLDRLLISQKKRINVEQQLDRLFALTQSIPDFDTAEFRRELQQFSELLSDHQNR